MSLFRTTLSITTDETGQGQASASEYFPYGGVLHSVLFRNDETDPISATANILVLTSDHAVWEESSFASEELILKHPMWQSCDVAHAALSHYGQYPAPAGASISIAAQITGGGDTKSCMVDLIFITNPTPSVLT